MSTSSTIPYEPVIVDINSLETTASRLICSIKRQWITNKLIFKKLPHDDYLIRYVVFLKDTQDEKSSIVLKIYPTNSNVYTDHQEQLHLIHYLSHYKIVPHILLTFTNGYFCNYIQGNILNIKEQQTHQLISRRLAEIHSILIKFHAPQLSDKLKSFIDLFTDKNSILHNRLIQMTKENEKFNNSNNKNIFKSLKSAIGLNTIPILPLTLIQLELKLRNISWTEISIDIDHIQLNFEKNWSLFNIPIVLCLNKMKINNFLFDLKTKFISIIDFDHCSHNYYLIDIVSYFLELAKDDYETKYPERFIQKIFLSEYLKHSKLNLSNIIRDQSKPTDHELEYLCDLCELLIAPVHLYWALWAFLQALLTKPISTFDYVNYGKIRLQQYYRYKDKFFHPLNHTQKHMPKF
ncbi:unnamed protein product [Rotaria sp. Silwood1]|nr:unnamed protein product [Rotaria sp. Silwood1]CAF3388313.1 unnamed protein product [Rotaria sp. Silwood1]CAF3413080.1 unnamed protein product [Rotaria sp. Silwood1]CAF4730802.1 unnamed protein product [Rotaria sp. Silwood1]